MEDKTRLEVDLLKIREIYTTQVVNFKGWLKRIKGHCRLVVGLIQYEIDGDYTPADKIENGIVYPYKETLIEVIGDITTNQTQQKLPTRVIINTAINPNAHVIGTEYSVLHSNIGAIAPQALPLNVNGVVAAGFVTVLANPFDLGAGSLVGWRRVKVVANAKHGSTVYSNNVIAWMQVEFEDFGARIMRVIAYQWAFDQVAFDLTLPWLARRVISITIRFNMAMIAGATAVYAISLTGEEAVRAQYVE